VEKIPQLVDSKPKESNAKESVTEEDERNLQRLQEILIDHRVEIERPRGEKKARLKRISDNVVG
jgi:hypothetical protein